MFRLCLDLATRPLLPKPDEADKPQPNARQRRDLGLRLPWLFENGLLPRELQELAGCIREKGKYAREQPERPHHAETVSFEYMLDQAGLASPHKR